MTRQPIPHDLMFEGQGVHAIALALLLAALAAASVVPGFFDGRFLGLSTGIWVFFAVADAIVHQVYVWLCWRLELHGQRLTRQFGDKAFRYFKIGFAVLIALRPLLAFALAWANRGTLPLTPWLGVLLGLALLAPGLYLMVSVRRYFGFDRAFGIDHFDASYREMPLVRGGIFKWTPNAMYVFGFLLLWAPALLFQSVAAMAAAAFSHGYIWVHFYCTERPDMRRIYGLSTSDS